MISLKATLHFCHSLSALAAAVLMSAPAQAAKSLVYCSEGSPSNFNPQIATDGTTFNATRSVFNQLVEFKYGETGIEPSLAESWTISPDGLTYTFKLRQNVAFHSTAKFKPTRAFNADDILFSFNRQRDKAHPYNKVGGGAYEYFDSMEMGSLIKDIRKVNDHEVVFVLNRPEAPFLANLAMDFSGILSAEYAEQLTKAKTPEKLDWEPVGTGAFSFVSYVKDQTIRFKAHKDYFRGKPKLDNLIFSITTDASVRLQKLKAGECQFINGPAYQDLAAIRANPKLRLLAGDALNIGYLAMNTEKAPFDKLKVRQAMNHALNRQSYIDAVYLGNAKIAKNPFPPAQWSYNDKVKDYDYNPEKAKQLLKEAGLADGFSTELWTMPVERPYMPNGKKLGELMQADLAKVGIKVKLLTFDWPVYLDRLKKNEHTLAQFGWTGDNGDPDNFLYFNLSCNAVKAGGNRANWCNKEFDALVSKAKTLSNQAERTKLYEEAQLIFKREAPWVTLAHSTVFRAELPTVSGYKMSPFGADIFEPVDIAP